MKKVAILNCALNFTEEVFADLKQQLPVGCKFIIPLPILKVIAL